MRLGRNKKSGFPPRINSRKKLGGGFTLIETLVVISIMMIISTMLLTFTNSSQTQIALSTSQATLAGVLTQAKALTLAKWTETSNPAELPCGFGVHFDPAGSALVIYQDSRVLPPSSCDTQSHNYVSGSSREIQTVKLDPRIEFVDTQGDIAFTAPYLKTSGWRTITLKVKNGTQKASVEVTEGGSITSL